MKPDKRKRDYPEAIAMYERGMSLEQIANFYGRTRQALWEWMKARGVKMRPQKRTGKENHFHRGTKASARAHDIFEKALKRGVVARSDTCETCGEKKTFKDGRSGVQAHHPDYNKPLDVMWLCQKCHHEWHKTNKAIPRHV